MAAARRGRNPAAPVRGMAALGLFHCRSNKPVNRRQPGIDKGLWKQVNHRKNSHSRRFYAVMRQTAHFIFSLSPQIPRRGKQVHGRLETLITDSS